LPVLALLFPLSGVRAQHKPLDRVRALLVIDTNADKVGENVATDGALMSHLLKTGLAKEQVDLTVLSGHQATPANVAAYYNNLRLGANEALLFFDSGHGGFAGDRHILTLAGGNIDRGRLLAAMGRHNPPLAVVLTNCCSNQMGALAFVNAYPDGNKEVMGNLLLRARGLVDATAAEKGEFAWCGPRGGCFTLALAGLWASQPQPLDADRDGTIQWAEVAKKLRDDTNAEFVQLCGGQVPQRAQFPLYFKLPKFEPVKPPARVPSFHYQGGKFVFRGDGKWVEDRVGGPSSDFVETQRTDRFVEMYDAARQTHVRLFGDHGEFRDPRSDRWYTWPGSEGKWVE
jgi:hypothetical protein